MHGRYHQLRMKHLLRLAYVLQDIKYGREDEILHQENLDIMVRSDHQSQPWIVGIKPTMVSLKPNDTHGRVHECDLHETMRVSHATLFSVIFKTTWCVLLTMHLTRTHSVIDMKIFDFIEHWMIWHEIWLKDLKPQHSMSLIHHHLRHLLAHKINHPLKKPCSEIKILHSFPPYMLRASNAWNPNLDRESIYFTKRWRMYTRM